MRRASSIELYNHIVRMMKESSFEDRELMDFILSEDWYSKGSLLNLIRQGAEEAITVTCKGNDNTAYQVLVEAFSQYILERHSAPVVKQRLRQRLYAWCMSIGEQYKIRNYEMYLDDLPLPVEADMTVELIKDLHAREGITKDTLAEKFGVSTKTIQTALRKLSGENEKSSLRIGGQEIHVPVSYHKEKHRDEERRFYTPNTLSPLVYQMNLMQVATLLQSFQYNYNRGNSLSLDLAVDTWCQLSAYAKSRIQEVFCVKDREFDEFLFMVEKESENLTYRFMTESEMMKEGNAGPNELLMLAYKGGITCDLTLGGPYRTMKNKKVMYDRERRGYYAVDADRIDGDRLYFSEEEVLDICEMEK